MPIKTGSKSNRLVNSDYDRLLIEQIHVRSENILSYAVYEILDVDVSGDALW